MKISIQDNSHKEGFEFLLKKIENKLDTHNIHKILKKIEIIPSGNNAIMHMSFEMNNIISECTIFVFFCDRSFIEYIHPFEQENKISTINNFKSVVFDIGLSVILRDHIKNPLEV